jgi:hypothetical protein
MEDWREELVKKYPILLETCWPTIGEGWKDLLDGLLSDLREYVKKEVEIGKVLVKWGEEPDHDNYIVQIRITQIKEKFGSLRVYINSANPDAQDIIWKAEEKSAEICELCGDCDSAKIRGGGWLKTLCDQCNSKVKRI